MQEKISMPAEEPEHNKEEKIKEADADWKKDHAVEVASGKIWRDTKFYALGKGAILVESDDEAGVYQDPCYIKGRSSNGHGVIYPYKEGGEREDILATYGFRNFHRVYKVKDGKWTLDRELDPPEDD